MELYQEILVKAFEGKQVRATIDGFDVQKMVESTCYQALEQIQAILRDETLSDPECFHRIERIVEVYESLGAAAPRHDFG